MKKIELFAKFNMLSITLISFIVIVIVIVIVICSSSVNASCQLTMDQSKINGVCQYTQINVPNQYIPALDYCKLYCRCTVSLDDPEPIVYNPNNYCMTMCNVALTINITNVEYCYTDRNCLGTRCICNPGYLVDTQNNSIRCIELITTMAPNTTTQTPTTTTHNSGTNVRPHVLIMLGVLIIPTFFQGLLHGN
jgi:hypothetical protein